MDNLGYLSISGCGTDSGKLVISQFRAAPALRGADKFGFLRAHYFSNKSFNVTTLWNT